MTLIFYREPSNKEVKFKDPLARKIHSLIITNHQVPPRIHKYLIKHPDKADSSVYFMSAKKTHRAADTKNLYISYNALSWRGDLSNHIKVRVQRIVVYANFMEYEYARVNNINTSFPSLKSN